MRMEWNMLSSVVISTENCFVFSSSSVSLRLSLNFSLSLFFLSFFFPNVAVCFGNSEEYN